MNYKLKLPKTYQIHPVFHVQLLTPHRQSRLVSRPDPPRPPPDILPDETQEYEVEAILSSREKRRKVEYLVKWKGYPLDEATWEKEENVKNAWEEITNFHAEHPDAVKSKRIASSVLTSPDFLAWRRKNIRPNNIRVDAHPREGVMSRLPNTNHYSFLSTRSNQLSKRSKILSDLSNLIDLADSSHISPLHSVTSSPFTTAPSSPVQITLEL
jgi:hypothetical protein